MKLLMKMVTQYPNFPKSVFSSSLVQFPKDTSIHINKFRKLLQLKILSDFFIQFPAAFGNPLTWVLVSFKGFMQAFSKIFINISETTKLKVQKYKWSFRKVQIYFQEPLK
jgi:hypothetical protein